MWGSGFAALSVWIPVQIVDDDSDGSVSAASVSGLLYAEQQLRCSL